MDALFFAKRSLLVLLSDASKMLRFHKAKRLKKPRTGLALPKRAQKKTPAKADVCALPLGLEPRTP